jgi:hypothetical protein
MLRRFLLALVGSIAAFIACSDSNNQKPTPPEAGAVCPQSPKDAVGKPCAPEGYACAVGYLCPAEVWQQAHCTCTKGVYACVDATGTDVAAGMDPTCSPTPPPTETCGQSPMDISGKSCNTASYTCYFTGATCPENGGKPYTDDCVCSPKPSGPDASAGLVWRCEVHSCL